MLKIKNSLIEIIITAGVLILLFHSSEPVIMGDSGRYLYGNVIDPPLYSLIIFIIQSLFRSLKAVIVFQAILIGFGIIYFTRTVSKIFDLDQMIKIIVAFFLFIPIIQFYDYLLTEPIGYAFTLLLFSSAIKLIYNFNRLNLFYFVVFVILLLLLRKQFIILYPVIFILFTGIFFNNKSKTTFVLLLAGFVSILITHTSVLSLENYFKQNSPNSKYNAFYFIYIDSIYISSSKDVKLFDKQNEKKMLENIFDEMNAQRSLIEHYDNRGHYSLSFNNIRYYSDNLIENLAKQEKTTVINIQKKISYKLLKANLGKYIKHIFKKFYDSTWLFILFPFFMLVAALINFSKYKSHLLLVVIFVSTFALANHFMIYVFGRIQPRYLIYSDFILLIIFFILFSIFLKKMIIYRNS